MDYLELPAPPPLDRVVHRFQVQANGQKIEMQYSPNPFQIVKKTITIETR